MVYVTFWQYLRFRLSWWWRRTLRRPLCLLGRHDWLFAQGEASLREDENVCLTCGHGAATVDTSWWRG